MKEFLQYPCTIKKVASSSIEDIKKIVHNANYNHTKAKRIVALAQKILNEHDGKMPETYEQVLKIDGVGEKIALLYMLVAFQQVL